LRRGVMVFNPSARGGAARRLADRVANRSWLQFRDTRAAGDARAVARDAAERGIDLVIAAGGDGTIHEVVNGLADHLDRVRLGVVPLGTANDFAKSIGLPLDPTLALHVAETGRPRRIDLIRWEGPNEAGLLINAATGGFSAVLHDRLNDELKQQWGDLAYLRAAMESLGDMPRFNASLRCDGEQLDLDTQAMVVANGRFAGGFELAPDAELADGRLDIGVATVESFAEGATLAVQMAFGVHRQGRVWHCRRSRRIQIDSDPEMFFIGDGESIGPSPLRFEVLSEAVEVMTPNEPIAY